MSQFVVGLGEVLWDLFPKGKRLGGAPANFAYHASQFGHEGLVVSAIGFDKLGSAIIAELDQNALPYHLDRVPFDACIQLEDGHPHKRRQWRFHSGGSRAGRPHLGLCLHPERRHARHPRRST